ncbi:MAG TPA: rod shape-determining protein MreC [Candidatus Paceibacterota bacterium]|nr:rod shape-determining protein MreC [Candidatus Paceibacterota bacterium]
MKKTFLAKRNALLTGRGISWGAWALGGVLLVLVVRLLAPNFFWKIFTPLFQTSDRIVAQEHAFLASFNNTATLTALNEKLTTENTTLATENQILQQKITNLSTLLGTVSSPETIPGVLAGVLARPPESPYDTLVLAAGQRGNVHLGMEAFGESGAPIGVVSSVLEDFSRVTLFSAPNMLTEGWVGHASVPLTIKGVGGGVLEATVPRTANIVLGDSVFVPGPGMLPIGSVVRIDSDPLSPGVHLRIMPAVNLFSVAWVELRATGVLPTAFGTSTLP